MSINASQIRIHKAHEKALVDAICHELPIRLLDVEKIDVKRIEDKDNKKIVQTFIELYVDPRGQPSNKQIADEIYCDYQRIGYDIVDCRRAADAIEDLQGRKRQPDVTKVTTALKYFSFSYDTPNLDGTNRETDYESVCSVLKELCKQTSVVDFEECSSIIVDAFNSSHSVVTLGSRTLVCECTVTAKGSIQYEFYRITDKRNYFAHLSFKYMAEGKERRANCFDVWFKHLDRKTYQGVVFDPSGKAPSKFLNMWTGFSIPAIQGTDRLGRILWHLEHVICDSNKDHLDYLLAWISHIIQCPDEKSEVCLVLKSEGRGTGKSTLTIILERILGEHSIRVQDSKHLLGEFNGHLANKLLVTVEEAFWSGSSKDSGKLRTMISENTLTIEAKGKDPIEVDSFHRFVMCTNNSWVVPQTKDERRFFVLEVSEIKKQNPEYFTELYEDIYSDEALGQLVNYLQSFDIKAFNLKKAPRTAALQEQVIESLPSEGLWLRDLLDNGTVVDSELGSFDIDLNSQIPKLSLFRSYIAYCDSMRIPNQGRIGQIKLGHYLRKVVGIESVGKLSIGGTRYNCYRTSSLDSMERAFNQYYEYQ